MAKHLYELIILSIQQHGQFYEKYKDILYQAIVHLIMNLRTHSQIFILWLRRFISEGIYESLKLENLL